MKSKIWTVMRYHMRRGDKGIMDTRLLKKILRSAKYVTLAMSKVNQPYLVSLCYGYDDEKNCIYFHCAKEGKKMDYLKANNLVWGQVLLDYGYSRSEDPCKGDYLYASVHFSGRVTFPEDPKEKQHAMECIIRQLDNNPDPLIKRLNPERLSRTTIGRIDIDYMSGKKPKEVGV